jgi:hypothetical protein
MWQSSTCRFIQRRFSRSNFRLTLDDHGAHWRTLETSDFKPNQMMAISARKPMVMHKKGQTTI